MASFPSLPAPAPVPGRAELLKAFDDARTGVRGLVESGVSLVPEVFRHPDPYASVPLAPPGVSIPVVDLSLPPHLAVATAASAARTWGFFHLVNALPADDDEYPARAIAAVRAFNELPAAERAPFYSRARDDDGFNYYSNIEPNRKNSPASWRDTMQILLGPNRRADLADRIPAACRAELLEWEARVMAIAPALLGLLSQGLALRPEALEDASCAEGKRMVCQYYPQCPEPERTLGIVPHTDPSVVNVLAQDGVGGLQVKHQDEDGEICWVDVQPVPGALIVNIGDLLQIMSNDKYTSVEHRVVMNTREEPRVSISIFFSPGKKGDSVFYGPLPELVSSENPPKYRNFTISEFYEAFFSRELASKALLDKFKISS